MNTQDIFQHGHVRVDNTDEYEPGQTVNVLGIDCVIVWILNENDMSVVKLPKVLH